MQKRDGTRTGQSRTELVDLGDNSISKGFTRIHSSQSTDTFMASGLVALSEHTSGCLAYEVLL
jgi:hypothetical protein